MKYSAVSRRLAPLTLLAAGLALVSLTRPGRTEVAEIAYSFWDADSGGIALARVEITSGRFELPEIILDDPKCQQPLKVRASQDRQTFIVTNLRPAGPHLFLAGRGSPEAKNSLTLAGAPDELRIWDDLALVNTEKDTVAVVDIAGPAVVTQWEVSETFSPPANSPEDICVTSDHEFALLSFQKDSQKGKKKGNRLAVYHLPELKLVSDLPLPRSRPDLHIDGNLMEQGPGPEVIHISEPTDTLLVTLDLYGAVGLMDWSAARQGQIANWQMLSTSVSGSWGNAFPDRGCPVQLVSRPYYLVCNAGSEGGAVLISLEKREVVWRRATPPGLETPVYFPDLRKAYSVCSGKTKRRTAQDVEKTLAPQRGVYVFDFSSKAAADEQPVTALPLDDFTFRIVRLSEQPPRLLLATGPKPDHPRILVSFDPISGRILDQQRAVGTLGRFETD